MKWSIRKAALIGLVIGIIGLLSTLTKESQDLSLAYIIMDVIEMLTPALLFAGIAYVRNLFVRG